MVGDKLSIIKEKANKLLEITSDINLHEYDLIVCNSSGGKDSIVAIFQMLELAKEQNYPKAKIVISHQDLGRMEWANTKELVQRQADFFGLEAYYSKRRNAAGKEQTLLEYVEHRGKWPSNNQRYCTSEFKRGPGARVVTQLTKDMGQCKILYIFGFRADESTARGKRPVMEVNTVLTTKKRKAWNYLPVHTWTAEKVWKTIHENKIPYHFAYDLGMPRLSCVFCIFAPFDALVLAGINNPELLDEYIKVENKIDHRFTVTHSLKEVKEAITVNYVPKIIPNWVM